MQKKVTAGGTIHWVNEFGHRSRTDGPSIIWKDGEEWWCINGKRYFTPEEMPLKLYIQYIKWNIKDL
jgi:hypothetical protein